MKKIFSVICLLAFLSQQGQAATFNVSTNADTGAGTGSLRDMIGQSNAAGGSNTIGWTTGGGGTLTLGSDLPTIGAFTTIDASTAPSAVAIAGTNAMPLGGAITINNSNTSQALGISAVLSGIGSLTKNGAGTLNLSGINTYAGGTTLNAGILNINSDAALGTASSPLTINGGTLQSSGNVFSSRSIALNAAATFDTQANIMSLAGGIGGAGSLTKIGTGILYLTGNNFAFSGGVLMNQGTLSITGDGALGSTNTLTFGGGTLQTQFSLSDGRAITLNAGGGFFDTDGSTVTFSGMISGGGIGSGLTQISSGTLLLTGNNTYLGGTTINNGGILGITSDANLGDPSGGIILSSGTLRTLAAIADARAIVLGGGGGTIDTNGFNSTFSGIISGSGGLTKINPGTLTLSGANTYTGGTTVNMGALQLGSNNALPTNGALTIANGAFVLLNGFSQTNSLGLVTNNGSIQMGSGLMTMNNGYQGAGTLAMTLQNGVKNITNTSGNALNLAGGTLALSLANPLLTQGQIFTPIAGTISGRFLAITSPAAFNFVPAYDKATGLTLTTQFVPFASIAAKANQSAVGSGIEPMRSNPTGDAATVLASLYTLDTSHLQSALDQIGPISLAAMGGMGMTGSSVQSAAVSQRMTVLADGADHGGYSNYTVSNRSSYPGTLVAAAGDETGMYDRGSGNSPWGFFTSGIGTVGRLREANSGAGLQPGYAFNTGGVAGGADYRINDHLAAGLSAGYLHGHASIYTPASGTVDDNSVRYGLYSTGFTDNFHANLYAGAAQDSFSTNRGIVFGTIWRTATASPQGQEFNLHSGLGYDINTPNWGIFTPFAGLNYDRLTIDPFTESGAGALDLSVGPQTTESLRSNFGLRFAQKAVYESGALTTYLSLGWGHEFENQSRPIGAQLASGAGNAFSVATGNPTRDGALLSGGFSADLSKQTAAKVDYTGDFRSHFMDNAFNVSMRYKF